MSEEIEGIFKETRLGNIRKGEKLVRRREWNPGGVEELMNGDWQQGGKETEGKRKKLTRCQKRGPCASHGRTDERTDWVGGRTKLHEVTFPLNHWTNFRNITSCFHPFYNQ